MQIPANPKILVFGATSRIAQAAIAKWATQHARFHLIARHAERLQHVAEDARVRGAKHVETACLDLSDFETLDRFLKSSEIQSTAWDLVLIAHGILPNQLECEREPSLADCVVRANFTSPLWICLRMAECMESRRHGCLMTITSVSGDRARRDSMIYAASKAGLSVFLDGLHHRLDVAGVTVIDIRPGFVDTPMTAHMAKGILFAAPERIAIAMDAAWKGGKSRVVYAPWFWWIIMGIICRLPKSLFRRLIK